MDIVLLLQKIITNAIEYICLSETTLQAENLLHLEIQIILPFSVNGLMFLSKYNKTEFANC